MKQISYIFKNGRLQRLDKDTQYPTEFYYSLKYFQNKYPNLNIIEDIDDLNIRYIHVDKILQKIKLPIYLSKIVNKENLKKIKNSHVVFSTNPGLAITLSPFIKRYKKKKKIKFVTINSGIFTNIYGSTRRGVAREPLLNRGSHASATGFGARQGALIDQDNRASTQGKLVGRCRPGGTSTHHSNIETHTLRMSASLSASSFSKSAMNLSVTF